MYTKLSPIRIIVSVLLVLAAFVVFNKILRETKNETPELAKKGRLVGVGMTLLMVGGSCMIASSKDVFRADGKKITSNDLKSSLLLIPDSIHVSENGFIPPAQAMQEQVEYMSNLETIKPLLHLGKWCILIGAVLALGAWASIFISLF